jgi:hypothetical protein
MRSKYQCLLPGVHTHRTQVLVCKGFAQTSNNISSAQGQKHSLAGSTSLEGHGHLLVATLMGMAYIPCIGADFSKIFKIQNQFQLMQALCSA